MNYSATDQITDHNSLINRFFIKFSVFMKMNLLSAILKKKWLFAMLFLFTGMSLGFFFSKLSASLPQPETATNILVDGYTEVPEYPENLTFAGEKIPLDIFYTRENLERELIVNTYWQSSTILALKRVSRWFPVIEPILKKNGVPDDFKYLCLIESNLTQVKSPAGAAGFWQIMAPTAKELGLEMNEDIDQRYDVELSTEAACKLILTLNKKYHNWSLTAAAYNAGQKRISELITAQQVNSYFDLLMPEETERYLFRIMAMKLIVEDPMKYSFKIEKDELYTPLAFNELIVTTGITNLTTFAKEHGITYKLLKHFNPWLRTEKLKNTTGKKYKIKIPTAPFDNTFGQI